MHLATRIPLSEARSEPGAWHENDRLRTEAARILVDAAIANDLATFVQPTIAFVYPPGTPADEDTPLGGIARHMRSALAAERETVRFSEHGGRGVVLRLGLLDGPGTGRTEPDETMAATLHVADAADALLRALDAPSGTYNVCRDGELVSNERFRRSTGWRPRAEPETVALDAALAARTRRS
jgi:nucleoside-diphosphate-sugar epimerase